MFTMMLPQPMVEEFLKIYHAEKPVLGTLPARYHAFGVMLQARRERLTSLLTSQALDNDPESTWNPVNEIAAVSAELVLLMIERGA